MLVKLQRTGSVISASTSPAVGAEPQVSLLKSVALICRDGSVCVAGKIGKRRDLRLCCSDRRSNF